MAINAFGFFDKLSFLRFDSGTAWQLYSVIPKQNGDKLPEQCYSLYWFTTTTWVHQRLIEARVRNQLNPPALMEVCCYQHLSLGFALASGW